MGRTVCTVGAATGVVMGKASRLAARRARGAQRNSIDGERCDLCLGHFDFSDVVFVGADAEDFTFCSECVELVMPGVVESMHTNCSICAAGRSHE